MKHLNMIENKIEITEMLIDNKKKYICEYCNKEYNKSNSIWYHVQKCKIQYNKFIEKSEIILEKKKEESMQQLKQEINELKDKIEPLSNNINELKNEITNEVKTLNNKIDNVKPVIFNLNVFLNEDCKHAISFDELLEQLQYHFDASRSLTEDTSITLLKSLSTMTIYERPIHCVDLKRNKLMIKDNDKWTKDMTVFNKLPKHASKSYSKHVNKWTERNPDFLENDEKSYQYNTYANKEVEEINTPRIIRNVSKVTIIPKKELTNNEE
jgi:uncharacterized protein YoxC